MTTQPNCPMKDSTIDAEIKALARRSIQVSKDNQGDSVEAVRRRMEAYHALLFTAMAHKVITLNFNAP